MANLNSWQRLDRVLSGQPFGNSSDGALTISENTTQSVTCESCSGAATSTSLTAGGISLSDGDVVIIIQSRGTGVGQWEANRVASGGGSVNLVMQEALHYTYTDSGASQAQVIKIPMYSTVTVDTGITWSAPVWDNDSYGVLLFAAKNASIVGTINASEKGHLGGIGDYDAVGTAIANQGEGTAGAGTASHLANGSGGGGARRDGSTWVAGGCGGGHASTGTAGEYSQALTGAGGTAVGEADLTNLNFGGGGGGWGITGGTESADSGKGDGGGIVFIFSKAITITGAITCSGEVGANVADGNERGAGGGGAGGSVLIGCQDAVLGTGLIVSSGGAGGTCTQNDGGAGSDGRIAVHYSKTISGTSTPSATEVNDTTLKENTGGFFAIL